MPLGGGVSSPAKAVEIPNTTARASNARVMALLIP
jgi:hypothetical protein